MAAMTSVDEQDLRKRVVAALRTVRDPEIPVNVYDLGLVYALDLSPAGDVHVRMTLTTTNCPVAGSMPPAVEQAVRAVAGVGNVQVELVWAPPWTRERMSEAAKLELNLDGGGPRRPGFVPLGSLLRRRE